MKSSKARRLAALGLAVLVAAVLFVWPSYPCLVVEDAAGKTLFKNRVSEGCHFTIRFIHSVARSPVEEKFEIIGPGEFRLRETVYSDFGAGMPEQTSGQTMTFEDGKIRLSGYDVAFSDLRLRVGHVADHTIIMDDGGTFRLIEALRPGAEVRLAVTTRRLGM